MKSKRNKRFINRLNYKYVALLLSSVLLLLVITELTNTTHLFHKSSVPAVIPVINTSSNPAPEPSTNNSQPAGSTSKDRGGSSKVSQNQSNATLPLYAPFGDFVSNHNPNLGGSPAPSQETSVCNTTPGAKCYIRLTKGSITTSLPTQTTDSKGATYWTWDIKKAGLTPGNWAVTAVASHNGQTKSIKDPLALNINP